MILPSHRTKEELNSGKKNPFVIEEPNSKKLLWYQWFNIRIRQYMILETFFFISLVMIFYRLQNISNQNDKVIEMVFSIKSQNNQIIEMVSSMKSQISILEIKVSGKPVQEKNQFDENTKQSIAEVLKNTEIIMESINSEHSAPNISIPKGPFRFNAANYLNGASVDTAHSSSSNLNTFIGLDQTNLVLLDRPQPPNDKAWCTNEHTPVLTLNLAKPIKPISVSYQHSKWQGIVPKETPRTYDVVACLDFNCENWKPLVSNCEYNQFGFNGNEQFCNISSHVPLIEKVQFRFTQNYGDLKMTCVNLVRVYGETEAPLKYENKKDCESEKICKDLKRFYHSYSPEYALRNTTCAFLYENDCCSRCPECCEECVITEYNSTTVTIVVWTICAFFFFLFFSPCGLLSNRFAKPPVE